MIRLLPFLIYILISCDSTQTDSSKDLSKKLNPSKETSIIKYDNEFINRIFDCEYRNLHFMWKNGKLVSMPFEKGIDTIYRSDFADNTPDDVKDKYDNLVLESAIAGNPRDLFSLVSSKDRDKYVVKIKKQIMYGKTISGDRSSLLFSQEVPGIYMNKKGNKKTIKDFNTYINSLYVRNDKILKRKDSLIKEDSRWKIIEKEVYLEEIAKQYLENNSVHPLEGIYLMNVNLHNPFKVFIYNSGEIFKVILLEHLNNFASMGVDKIPEFPFPGFIFNNNGWDQYTYYYNFAVGSRQKFIDRFFRRDLNQIDYNDKLFTWCNTPHSPLYATIDKTSDPNIFSINWYGEMWFYGSFKNRSYKNDNHIPEFSLAQFSDNKLIEVNLPYNSAMKRYDKNVARSGGETSRKARLLKTFPTYDRENKTNVEGGWKGNGSGLIISKGGHIVTNYHVVDDANSIEIEFKDDKGINKYKAEVVNSDEETDLAILKIQDVNFKGFKETPNFNLKKGLAESGENVYAYGYPMALSVMGKEIKITNGIISSQTGLKGDIKTYQTTAPIQGGNSGGPLFDDKGNLLGINSSGIRKDIADNVGYTIKTNYILNLIDVLPEKIELPYSYSIRWLSNQKQIKRLSEYTVLIKVK